jgi:hypothetical protein
LRYIWIGASSLANKLMNKWSKFNKDIYPYVLLDNDNKKVGTYLKGVLIDAVINIQKYLDEPYEIIITTTFVNEIKSQLHEMGIYDNIIDYDVKDKAILRQYLEKNADLHCSKASNRCFIIGTGPSLRELDLRFVMNEDKIMVNHIDKDDELIILNPNFWVIADPVFWLHEQEFLDPVVDTLKSKLPSTQLLIPDDVLSYATRDLLQENNIHYYALDKTAKYEPVTIDFAAILPCFAQNVISVALMLAIYLKYEEIILIGCDHSWWGYSEVEIEQGVIPPHYYNENEEDIEFVVNSFKSLGYQRLQETIQIQKKEYAALRSIAEQNGLRVYNATPGGYLESFIRVRYKDLFH